MPKTFAAGFLAVAMSVVFGLALFVWPSAAFAGVPSYKIISQDNLSNGGTAGAVRVSVRIDGRQSEAALKTIADEVRARLPAQKVVRSVGFYLSGMPLTAAAWAEVSQSPVQKVTVSGLRLEEEIAYSQEAALDTRNRVGVWLTSPPALPGRLTIYRDAKGKVFAEWQLRSGQTTTDTLNEARGNRGRRFDIAGGDGGYYQMGANGTLELGNGTTVIAVAEPLKPAVPKTPEAAAALPAVMPKTTAAAVSAAPAAVQLSVLPSGLGAKAQVDAAQTAPAVAGIAPSAAAKPQRKRSAAVRATKSLSRRADVGPGEAIRQSLSQ